MNPAAENTVVDFIHEAAAALPVERRTRIYRAIATTTASESIAEHFHLCADDLSAAEARCQQLALDFKRRAS